jgi:myo-inositol catabolism protein IolS
VSAVGRLHGIVPGGAGDKTMLATITRATPEGCGVWLGSTVGMVCADALAILVGLPLSRRRPDRPTRPGRGRGVVVLACCWWLKGCGQPAEAAPASGLLCWDAPAMRNFPWRRTFRSEVAIVRYRRLGRTGLRVSVIGVGTWQLGGEWGRRFTQQQVDGLLGRAREVGVNLVDTAECYGDHLAETLIGAAIRQHRDDWVVATKFGHRFHPEALQRGGGSPDLLRTDHWTPTEVVAQLEASLRALATDHVDLYQMHSGPEEAFDQDELWEVLARQVARGTVRHLGASLGGDDVDQARRATEVGASVVQVGYNRLDRTAQQGVLPACLDQDLGVVAREPLANGYLSGKYRPGAWVTASDDWRSGHDPAEARRTLELVEEIRRTEVPEGVAMAPWAIGWCLQHPAVSCVVAGCKSVEQLESNAGAADLDLVKGDHPQATTP